MHLYGFLFIHCCIGIQNIVTGYITLRIYMRKIVRQQNLLNDLLPLFFPYLIRFEEIRENVVIIILATLTDLWHMPEQNSARGWG